MSKEQPYPQIIPIFTSGIERTYKCSACEATFETEQEARVHIDTSHPEEKKPDEAQKLKVKSIDFVKPKKVKKKR